MPLSFVLAPVIAACHLAGAAIAGAERAVRVRLVVALGVTLLAPLANPRGYRLWGILATYLGDVGARVAGRTALAPIIAEWHPPLSARGRAGRCLTVSRM